MVEFVVLTFLKLIILKNIIAIKKNILTIFLQITTQIKYVKTLFVFNFK